MSENELVVFVHVVGSPDADSAPGLLTRSRGVLVWGPAPALPDGAALEVVITPVPPSAESPVERLAVVDSERFVNRAGATTALLLRLERASAYEPVDLGDLPEDLEAKVADADNDVRTAVADAGLPVPGSFPKLPADQFDDLARIEREQRAERPEPPPRFDAPGPRAARRPWCWFANCH